MTPGQAALADAAALELARINSWGYGRGPAPADAVRQLVNEVTPRVEDRATCHVCGRLEVAIRDNDDLAAHPPIHLPDRATWIECLGAGTPYQLPNSGRRARAVHRAHTATPTAEPVQPAQAGPTEEVA